MIDLSPDPYVAEQQMRAVIFCLVAFGYIDRDFAPSERMVVRKQLSDLADRRAQSGANATDGYPRSAPDWDAHHQMIMAQYDEIIRGHFTESVAEGETTEQWVISKLKVGCFEVLRHFDATGQRSILDAVDELMMADGVEHPEERAFRDELLALIERASADTAEMQQGFEDTVQFRVVKPTEPMARPRSQHITLQPVAERAHGGVEHAFFAGFEWPFAMDTGTFARQAASEMHLINATMKLLAKQRQAGAGKLRSVQKVSELKGQPAFLDSFTYAVPIKAHKTYDLLVLGDLHGCYSCMKAAILQGDFFGKVERYRKRPDVEPMPYLILLGDYIDRGRFSFSGTLRMMMQLLIRMPEHVLALRGNHEHYIEMNGRVIAPVRPSEAMDEIAEVADNQVFVNYMHLFESLPTVLLFDQLFFVHGGIPRSDTLEDRWRGLSSLNDAVLRFEMLWSDPSDVDVVPLDLQRESARFAFGRLQFQEFMQRIGCHTLIRGHERVPGGFHVNYHDPEGTLLTLFSAGGANNMDLPLDSNYREVTPAAFNIRIVGGHTEVTPFLIDYEPFNQPQANAFHATMPERRPDSGSGVAPKTLR